MYKWVKDVHPGDDLREKMIIKNNELDVNTYLQLRDSVNWKKITREQAEKALKNSLFTVLAIEEDKVIGMGRLVGDGAVICYIQDLIIIPEYQGTGVGYKIVDALKEYVREIKLPDTEIMLDLMCAKGREEFYRKCGFTARPNEKLGPGMIQYL